MGCYHTLIPYISIGNCNTELIFGMRASLRILCKYVISYPIISKKIYFCDVITSVLYWARKFVLVLDPFLEAHSFPRSTLLENCSLLGTDNVRGQISKHIFAPNRGQCLYILENVRVTWELMSKAVHLP